MRRPSAMLRLAARLRRSTAGAAAVEAALVLPVLLAFTFGVLDLSRAMMVQNSLQYATDAAARCAAINTTACGNEEAIKAYAARQIGQFHISANAFAVASPACGKQVSATYSFQSVLKGFVRFSPILTARSCHP